jgi:TRAP-type mannitol/chloroaromatic compound transport system permease small subunit
MKFLDNILQGINCFTQWVGRLIAWLCLLLVSLTVLVVLLRYFFGMGSIAVQEAVTYVHSTIFMLGLAVALQRGGHVRVDIFYRNFSVQRKAWVNFLGGMFFLLPFCGLMLFSSWDYVLASWAIKEASAESGGIAAVYLLKSLMILMPITLALQGLSQILNSLLCIKGITSKATLVNQGDA